MSPERKVFRKVAYDGAEKDRLEPDVETRQNGLQDCIEYREMKINQRIASVIILALMLVVSFSLSYGQATLPTSQKAEYPEVFQAIWQKVNDNFYDPQFVGVDWKDVGNRYRPQVNRVRNDAEFFELMKRMLKELPVSHLQIGMPRESGLVGVGVRTQLIDGKHVVVDVPTASDAQRRGIRVGDSILNPEDEIGKLGSNANLRLKGCDGRERNVQVRRESHSQSERPSIRWRTFSVAGGERIGYLRAVRFDDDVAPLVDAAMAELKSTSGLIIDARDNSGGNMSFVRLSSYLSSGEHLVAALLTRHYLQTQGQTPKQIDPGTLPKAVRTYTDEGVFTAMRSNNGAVAIYSEDLGKDRYRGKVVVLINEETASAAEGFAWHVKLKTDAKLIGRKTAGALLGAEYYTLPGGWRLGVPTHSGWGPDGKPVIDEPVTPHMETKLTIRDVCSGTDPDLSKALDFLAGQK